ncbi:Ger(x)C family spore germination protein [Bacillus sp. Marseille-Q1617]|uniref:Ger(x)C family spore germination protein n=1 Tax=Bacillus sp. Marseille-Q1617 TaxID=2736887 RepID=UPI00158A3CB8|nr:Ger(x)C family spore germination protein [Bacillus sp. Marseille-Q1617]
MKRYILLFMVLLAPVITGCVEYKYLEKLGLITAVGYDETEDKELKATVVLYQFNPAMQDVEKVLTSKANSSKGNRISLNFDTDHKLVSGQLRIAIYGRELASKGISHLVDTLERDSSIGNMVYLAVSDTTSEDLLTYQMTEKHSNKGTYLYNLVKQNVESEFIIAPTLQEFITDYGSIGKDPILPILAPSKGTLGIDGFAIFHKDKFVKELKKEDMFYLRALVENYHTAGSFEVGLPLEPFKPHLSDMGNADGEETNDEEKIYIVFDSIKSDHLIKAGKQDKPTFTVKLTLDARLHEITEQLKLSDPKTLKLVEAEASKFIEKKIKENIKMLQEVNADPIGFGMEYKTRRNHASLTDKEWEEKYKDAEFDVSVQLKLIRTGVTD